MRKRRRPKVLAKPPLTVAMVLAWADDFHDRIGRWPVRTSGRIVGGLGLTWSAIDGALWQGNRGFPKGGSLAKLLAEHRGYRHARNVPRLRVNDILRWADAHYERTGEYPGRHSGRVLEAPGESWNAVDRALARKTRGLRGGYTLADLLARRRGRRNKSKSPHLTVGQILRWADAWHELFGVWPTTGSGPVGNTGETWRSIDKGLRNGTRGLRKGTSLYRLLKDAGRFEGERTPYRRR